jgi:hypothetical protein
MEIEPQSEVGRELRVSELQPRTIVLLHKVGKDVAATMWVIDVGDLCVHFRAGALNIEFLALRCGADLEEICDDTHTRLKIFEYLGEP